MSGELPPGWATPEISEILQPLADGRTIHQGWSPRCEKGPSLSDEEWGVLKTTAIQAGEFLPQHNKRLPNTLEPRPRLEVYNGDLLLTSAGPRSRCGVACMVKTTRPRLMISGKMYRFRFDTGSVLPQYIEAYLQSHRAWTDIDEMKTGVSDSGLNLTQNRFRRLKIPLAPVAEQQRIVVAIEEHFSRLDAVDASMRSAMRRAEVLQQAVIDRAIRGERCRLGDRLSEPLRNGCSPPRSSDGDTRILTLTAVTDRAFVEENTRAAFVPKAQQDQLTLQPDDILVQRSNTPELVGTAARYSGPSGWAVFPDLLIRVRPDHTLLPAYLELALRSSSVRRYFRLAARGIAGSMPKISQSTIEELEIPIPSIAEQQETVKRISSEVETVKQIQDGVNRACKRAESLRRAVLAAAFAGQLVPQNPCDEPASTLLERIAAARTTTPKRQKARA